SFGKNIGGSVSFPHRGRVVVHCGKTRRGCKKRASGAEARTDSQRLKGTSETRVLPKVARIGVLPEAGKELPANSWRILLQIWERAAEWNGRAGLHGLSWRDSAA